MPSLSLVRAEGGGSAGPGKLCLNFEVHEAGLRSSAELSPVLNTSSSSLWSEHVDVSGSGGAGRCPDRMPVFGKLNADSQIAASSGVHAEAPPACGSEEPEQNHSCEDLAVVVCQVVAEHEELLSVGPCPHSREGAPRCSGTGRATGSQEVGRSSDVWEEGRCPGQGDREKPAMAGNSAECMTETDDLIGSLEMNLPSDRLDCSERRQRARRGKRGRGARERTRAEEGTDMGGGGDARDRFSASACTKHSVHMDVNNSVCQSRACGERDGHWSESDPVSAADCRKGASARIASLLGKRWRDRVAREGADGSTMHSEHSDENDWLGHRSVPDGEEGVQSVMDSRVLTSELQSWAEARLARLLARCWRTRGGMVGSAGQEGDSCTVVHPMTQIEMGWTGGHEKLHGRLVCHVRYLQWVFRAVRRLAPGKWAVEVVPLWVWLVIGICRRRRFSKCCHGLNLASEAEFKQQNLLANEMLDWYGQCGPGCIGRIVPSATLDVPSI